MLSGLWPVNSKLDHLDLVVGHQLTFNTVPMRLILAGSSQCESSIVKTELPGVTIYDMAYDAQDRLWVVGDTRLFNTMDRHDIFCSEVFFLRAV